MTKLLWAQPGTKLFEAGVDRGVLYVDDVGVVWNGLVAVNESVDGEVASYYLDGFKTYDLPLNQEYIATVEAFTYPDEFAQCEGDVSMTNGLLATNQKKKTFGLCYRTNVGNEIDSENFGYKLHLVYNATAKASNRSYSTFDNNVSPITFSWDIVARSDVFGDVAPTAHFVVDARKTPEELLRNLEDILYGDDVNAPRLPTADELFFMFEQFSATYYDADTLNEAYYFTIDAKTLADSYTDTLDAGGP